MKMISKYFMLLAGLLAVVAISCTKKGSSEDPAVVTGELWLRGSVVNAITDQPVAGATVEIAGQATLTTDAAGVYKVNVKTLIPGNYILRATANGYGYGSGEAQVSSNATVANAIRLLPLSEPVVITPQGGSLSAVDPEALVPGAHARLNIPAAAFAQPVSLSLTRFTGISVPGIAPVGMLNMGTFHVGPAGLTASVSMLAEIPLPLNSLQADVPLLKYDPITDVWELTGAYAQVNQNTGIAHVAITTSGTYSLGVTGAYSETPGASGMQTTIKVDPAGSSVVLAYLAKNTFQGAVPGAISVEFLTNLVSQNTYIHGRRISFSDSTYATVNYIGHKPDSVPTSKSTAGGYYKWVPQVGMHWEEIPAVTVVDGITVSGLVSKELQYDRGIWQFVHDQGGGGK